MENRYKTRILMEELLKVRSPILGFCTLLVPVLVFLWVVSLDVKINIVIIVLVAIFAAFIAFMAVHELLTMSNYYKTHKTLRQNQVARTDLELIMKNHKLTGLTSTQQKAIKSHLKRHL